MGTDPTPLPRDLSLPRPDAIANAPAQPAAGANATRDAAAFHSLLEGLAGRARELDRAAQDVNGPEALLGAVETARASLEDALSLREQLLAAYHETLQRGAPSSDQP